MKHKILVVDDERDLCEILRVNLDMAGYQVTTAYSAEQALQHDLRQFDLMLLDIMLDGMSGLEMAKRVKADSGTAHIPIIFVTAKDTEEDTLQGFGIGADDYIAKPFSLREVMARLQAVLARTAGKTAGSHMLRYDGLEVNTDHHTVTIDGQAVALTRTEFDLLRLLLSERGHVLSRSQLIAGAWPRNVVVTDRAVDVNITRLRKKLGNYAKHIITRSGFGYTFDATWDI